MKQISIFIKQGKLFHTNNYEGLPHSKCFALNKHLLRLDRRVSGHQLLFLNVWAHIRCSEHFVFLRSQKGFAVAQKRLVVENLVRGVQTTCDVKRLVHKGPADLSHLGLGAFGKPFLTREKQDILGVFKQQRGLCFAAGVFKFFSRKAKFDHARSPAGQHFLMKCW